MSLEGVKWTSVDCVINLWVNGARFKLVTKKNDYNQHLTLSRKYGVFDEIPDHRLFRMSYYIETAAWHAYAPLSYVRTLMASRLCQFTGQQVAVMASDGSEIHFASFEFQNGSA